MINPPDPLLRFKSLSLVRMDRLKSQRKAIPKSHKQEDTWTLNTPRALQPTPRADLTLEERQAIKKEKKRKLKNSDIFIVKGK